MFRKKIKDRVEKREGGKVNGEIIREDKEKMDVKSKVMKEIEGGGKDLIKRRKKEKMENGKDRMEENIVKEEDGEGKEVKFKRIIISIEDEIGRRIVRVGINRIREVKNLRSRKEKVEKEKIGDFSNCV